VAEVDFWQPSGGRAFRVLAPGEPFSSRPITRATAWSAAAFSDSAQLRVSEEWELFGEANGADSVEQMRARIGRYRRTPISASEDSVIGACSRGAWAPLTWSSDWGAVEDRDRG
jgi:putative restriction endonuclease